MRLRGVVPLAAALALLGPPALADTSASAAQCAAFWLGRDDFARSSAWLDRDPGDAARAESFRAAALERPGASGAELAGFIAAERRVMAFLFEAMVIGADAPAQAMHDRLLAACAEDRAGAAGDSRP